MQPSSNQETIISAMLGTGHKNCTIQIVPHPCPSKAFVTWTTHKPPLSFSFGNNVCNKTLKFHFLFLEIRDCLLILSQHRNGHFLVLINGDWLWVTGAVNRAQSQWEDYDHIEGLTKDWMALWDATLIFDLWSQKSCYSRELLHNFTSCSRQFIMKRFLFHKNVDYYISVVHISAV